MESFLDFYNRIKLNESQYVRHNQNPFGNTKSGDCVVRSLSLALNIPYEKICRTLGKRFIKGKGQDENDPATLKDLRQFEKSTNKIKLIDIDLPLLYYVFQNKDYEPTKEWENLEKFADTHNGKYIVLVRQTFDMTKKVSRELFRDSFHVVYVDGTEHKYYDLMDNDPGDMIVYGFFKVK